ncbi:peptidoglycan-binding protein [Streptomyces sp. BI20]|uniref:peptidoglycan-binding domain-containing protein n=1 Tax=Streptomyces sp. BI20 TaxID=3403460 RepID=UPI003C76F6EC
MNPDPEHPPDQDEGLLVRPYVPDPIGPPAPEPEHRVPPPPAPRRGHSASRTAVETGPPTEPAPPSRRAERERGLRAPLLLLGALAVLAGGTLAVLFLDEDPAPAGAGPRPAVSVPVLQGAAPAPEDTPSTRDSGAPSSPTPTRSATPTPSRSAPASASASASAEPTPSATPEARPTPTRPGRTATAEGTLRPGDDGDAVRGLQGLLYGQGFTYVERTGEYDEDTRRGVEQFQRDRGLTGDPYGVYGPTTRAALTGG